MTLGEIPDSQAKCLTFFLGLIVSTQCSDSSRNPPHFNQWAFFFLRFLCYEHIYLDHSFPINPVFWYEVRLLFLYPFPLVVPLTLRVENTKSITTKNPTPDINHRAITHNFNVLNLPSDSDEPLDSFESSLPWACFVSMLPTFLDTEIFSVDSDPGSGQFLLLWCRCRASFSFCPHSMLRRSLCRRSLSVWWTAEGLGGSGNFAQHLLIKSVFLQFALSKLQFPTLNSSP